MTRRNKPPIDQFDDAADVHEYASPPCYMHEVDPSYLGLLLSARPVSDPASENRDERLTKPLPESSCRISGIGNTPSKSSGDIQTVSDREKRANE